MSKSLAIRTLLALALVVSVTAFVVLRNLQIQGQYANAPLAARIDEAKLDFGTVWAQQGFVWNLPVINASDVDLRILDVESSCSCTVIEKPQVTIPPGQTRNVTVKLDLTRNEGKATPEGPRKFSVTVMLNARARNDEISRWQLKGLVRDSISLSPPFLDFGDIQVEDDIKPRSVVRVRSVVPLAAIEADFDRSQLEVDVKADGKESKQFSIDVTHLGLSKVGKKETAISIRPKTTDGVLLPAWDLPVRSRGVGDVVITPDLTHLGTVHMGEDHREVFKLSSRSGTPFGVKEIRTSAPTHVRAQCDQEITATHTCEISVNAPSIGQHSFNLEIDWEHGTRTPSSKGPATGRLVVQMQYLGVPMTTIGKEP